MDGVTAAVIDLVKSDCPWPMLVNAVHPYPVQWREVFGCINDQLAEPLPVVPYKDWLQVVETIAAQGAPADLERVVSRPLVVMNRLNTCMCIACHQDPTILSWPHGRRGAVLFI